MLENIVGRFSLRLSLSALFALLALLACAVVGTAGYIQAADEIRKATDKELGLIASSQARSIVNYKRRLTAAIGNLAAGAIVPRSVSELSIGFGMETQREQNINTFRQSARTPDQRALYSGNTENATIYDWKHAEVHSSFLSYWEDLDLSELYLLDDKKNVVYTVTKSEEFMQNLDSADFGEINTFYDKIMSGEATSLASKGLQPYPTAEPSLVIAHGVTSAGYGSAPQTDAIIAFRVGADRISRMLARNRLSANHQIVMMADAAGNVIAATDNVERTTPLDLSSLTTDENGRMTGVLENIKGPGTFLVSASTIDFNGATYHVIAAYDRTYALAGLTTMGLTMAGLSLLALIGASLAGVFFSNIVARPINVLTKDMRDLADGDLETADYAYNLHNEVGSMAAAVGVFREQALEKRRIEGETERMRNQSESERAEREAVSVRDNRARSHAMDTLGTALKSLAHGNVSHRIAQPFAAEFDQLRVDYNDAADKLADALYRAARSADSIRLSSAEVSNAAADLAKRTEKQAASIEQSSETLSHIADDASEVAGRTDQVQTIVQNARKQAAASAEIVDKAMNAMREIEDSSSEITQIVSVINEIAFQTNLLALNAGVEAARAGDAGRGFGVVAQEVRQLAQRCGDAASEIRELITRSVDKVKSGSALVSDTGETLKRIVDEVADISEHVTAITGAMRNQSDGLAQVSRTIRMMDQETQKNAAIAEESTAGSQVLANEAARLNEQFLEFDVSAAEETDTAQAA